MDFITSSGKRLIKISENSSSRQYHEGESQRSHEASSKKRPRIDFATRQYQLHEQQPEVPHQAIPSNHLRLLGHVEQEKADQLERLAIPTRIQKKYLRSKRSHADLAQQHEAGPSRQGDARPARTEKRKPHQTLSPETSKYQRQDTASSRDALEDFAASLEAELANKEDQADARPARAKKRQDTAFSSPKSLEAVSVRLKAEFTKQDTPRGLNRDGQEELVLRKVHRNNYDDIVKKRINDHLNKAKQGKGRYTQEELCQSKEKLQALKPEIMNGTKEAYNALQGIIKNPSNDVEKSAAELLVYHMTKRD